MNNKIAVFDSTLRDGAQAVGISFSVEDKIKIVKALDKLGITYIEAGNPGSNPKDLEFFERIKDVKLENAKVVAFGSTRRRNIEAKDDKNVISLLSSGAETIAVFGKSWDFHVKDIINTTLEENIEMIKDTISYLVSCGKEVIFDAEHFFDGFKENEIYALKTIETAKDAGAVCICLCDTNGGCFPDEIYEICKKVCEKFPDVTIGIHCHNDCAMAVANTVIAVKAGVRQIQGTFVGFGERCGNAALCAIIANLQAKRNYLCIPQSQIKSLTHVARKIAEIANYKLSECAPFVGRNAFAHKGGMHIDGVSKAPRSFEHIDPEIVGNRRKFLTSEVAGRTTILSMLQKIMPNIEKNSPEADMVIERLKQLEYEGYQFEDADGGFELLVRKTIGKYKPFFELVNFKIIGEQPYAEGQSASALIKIIVDGKTEITAAEGSGPVNALDKALRKALEVFYPSLSQVHLTDYKVRVLDGKTATASKVRVLIESGDGVDMWTTVGVSNDIIEASWIALVDSIEYKLIKDIENKFKAYL